MKNIDIIIRTQFGKLGSIIVEHPRLKEGSRFLFRPGPDDAGKAHKFCGSAFLFIVI